MRKGGWALEGGGNGGRQFHRENLPKCLLVFMPSVNFRVHRANGSLSPYYLPNCFTAEHPLPPSVVQLHYGEILFVVNTASRKTGRRVLSSKVPLMKSHSFRKRYHRQKGPIIESDGMEKNVTYVNHQRLDGFSSKRKPRHLKRRWQKRYLMMIAFVVCLI